MRKILNQARLKEVLTYDPKSGNFSWNIVVCKRIPIGAIAGSLDKKGYLVIRIDRRIFMAHRLAWFYITGDWPEDQIDHINNIKNDNRLCNLRKATNSQNQANQSLDKSNTSGLKGVFWFKRDNKWKSSISVNKKQIHIGYFDCPAAASFAYQIDVDKHFGEFARI